MTTTLSPTGLSEQPKSTWFNNLCRTLVHKRFSSSNSGVLQIVDALGTTVFGEDGIRAEVQVHDLAFYRELALGGHMGAARSYLAGFWTSPDLTAVFQWFIRYQSQQDTLDTGIVNFALARARWVHQKRANTIRGSKKNIAEHYDLGNDLFETFLDPSMTYSCAFYEKEDTTLEEAQRAKLERICRKLDLGPSDHLLEIGTGWGSFAIHAASNHGCRVTTTTISEEQHALATQRISKAGLSDRITVLLQDYRTLEGCYDKLASIEMIEAVGAEFIPTYVETCSRLLKPDGLMCLQAITFPDQHFHEYVKRSDFIQTYVFPGGCLVSLAALTEAVKERTNLKMTHLEDIGHHYAVTLRDWYDRFLTTLDEVRTLGYSERFIRLWTYYLCYCEAGFTEGRLGTLQLVYAKPSYRPARFRPSHEPRDAK